MTMPAARLQSRIEQRGRSALIAGSAPFVSSSEPFRIKPRCSGDTRLHLPQTLIMVRASGVHRALHQHPVNQALRQSEVLENQLQALPLCCGNGLALGCADEWARAV